MNARITNPALVGLSGAVLALAAGELFLFDGMRALQSEASTTRASLVSAVSGYRMSTALANDERGEQLDWLREQVQEAMDDVQSAAGTVTREVQRYGQMLARRLALKQRRDREAASAELNGALETAERAHAAIGELAGELHQARAAIAGTGPNFYTADSQLIDTRADLTILAAGAAENAASLDSLHAFAERAYHDIDLRKGQKAFAVRGVVIELRKADPRRNLYTVALIAGTQVLEKEDRGLNEPVPFYLSAREHPCELVVTSIEKNHIKGYVSMPRFTLASN
jgi:hypothetical protein